MTNGKKYIMQSLESLKAKKESIRCCYKISETDVDCLFTLLDLKEPKSSSELAEVMKLSKTTVENSMKKLMELGLVRRIKIEEKKIGRPKFVYSLVEDFFPRIRADLKDCAEKILSATS
ncbi:putative transcriptional regulator [Metallosphaera yellowstonensis MK1]|jgi:Predicted transcriptional regulator|uniref:Putative transcriptional regulator n=2 Tax=Metallosphaera TaxID=41980 RepID=H2C7X7_9CREN|nr:putative transcriptional regulator [Metallosphaera yellowstonensis MK1]